MTKSKVKNNKSSGNKTGIAKAVAALALSAVLIAGGVVIGYGGGTHWTYKRGNVQTAVPVIPDSPSDDDQGGAILTPSDNENGDVQIKARKLARSEYEENGISAQAENAFTLTATIYPEEAFNKAVDWTIAWNDANSAWASGKNVNDYYSITPTSDGALTANAVCKQAFAEPVTITCQIRESTISATVRADYVSKLEIEFHPPKYCLDDEGYMYGYYEDTWSIGTITGGTVKIDTIDMVFSDELREVISYICNLSEFEPYYNDNYDNCYFEGSCLTTYEDYRFEVGGFLQDYHQMFGLKDNLTPAQEEKARNIIYKGFNDKCGKTTKKDWVTYNVYYSYTIDGQTYSDCKSVNADFDTGYANIYAMSMVISETQIKH